jgi:hypothetical protein
VDSFRNKFKRFADKVNDKLEESISSAEERARVGNERNRINREKLEEIEKSIANDEEFLQKYNAKLGALEEDQFEVGEPSAKNAAIDQYLPIVVNLLRDKAGPAILDILSDPGKLTELARSGYQALPLPVRMLVKEQSFIDWVVAHQSDIFDKLKLKLAPETSIESNSNILPPGDCPVSEVALESDC